MIDLNYYHHHSKYNLHFQISKLIFYYFSFNYLFEYYYNFLKFIMTRIICDFDIKLIFHFLF